MERPIFKPVGTLVEELDTPALVVDLAVMERNIETVHGFFRQKRAKVRPHIKVHKCPAIAHKQLAAGGAVGICTATVGEAEVFAQAGFTDILITSEIVTGPKINRLCAMAHHARITVAVDNPKNVADLSEAAQSHGVTLNVLVDINTRLNRCGVDPGKSALELAKVVTGSNGLHFAGLMTFEGTICCERYEDLVEESKQCIQKVLDTREMVEKEGLEVEVVSVGGTHNYEIVGAMDGVTEVQAGSYVLMDHFYSQCRQHLEPAAKVLSMVVSHPEKELALADAGRKGIGVDKGLPVVEGIPGGRASKLGAEHCWIELEKEAQQVVDLGMKVWLVPWDLGLCANLYDYIHAVRGGRLEAMWRVEARGRYD